MNLGLELEVSGFIVGLKLTHIQLFVQINAF